MFPLPFCVHVGIIKTWCKRKGIGGKRNGIGRS
nr:MAG TPA: hypothetical protein [Caudoviricetes sp.]DAZ32420.1 MAG TPA: hypothetical protein [Caudoviricetes sp.]